MGRVSYHVTTRFEDFEFMNKFPFRTEAWSALEDWKYALMVLQYADDKENILRAGMLYQQVIEKLMKYILEETKGPIKGISDKHALLPLAEAISYPDLEKDGPLLSNLSDCYIDVQHDKCAHDVHANLVGIFDSEYMMEQADRVARTVYQMSLDVLNRKTHLTDTALGSLHDDGNQAAGSVKPIHFGE